MSFKRYTDEEILTVCKQHSKELLTLIEKEFFSKLADTDEQASFLNGAPKLLGNLANALGDFIQGVIPDADYTSLQKAASHLFLCFKNSLVETLAEKNKKEQTESKTD